MKFTWNLIFIIAAILFGMFFFQKGEKTSGMSGSQIKDAEMYRNYAYLLWGIAIAVALYYYYIQGEAVTAEMPYGWKANMCGCAAGMGSGKAYMCGVKAPMCGGEHAKANMCGDKMY